MRVLRTARRRRPGMTLTDVCVVLAIILMLAAVMPATLFRLSNESLRSKCSSNLKNIAAALIVYSNTNSGNYPRTLFNPDDPTPTQFTGAAAAYPFKAGGPAANDVTAAIYLLLRTSGMPGEILVCPTSGGDPYNPQKQGPVLSRSNFPSPQNLTYSFNNPYPSAAALKAGWKWNSTLDTDDVLAADLNPGTPGLLTISPTALTQAMQSLGGPNHGGKGQNVLYGDYHVAWQNTPFCGVERTTAKGKVADNIYTAQTTPASIMAPPQDAQDSVLLPTAADGFKPDYRPEGGIGRITGTQWAAGGVLVLVLMMVILIIRRGRLLP